MNQDLNTLFSVFIQLYFKETPPLTVFSVSTWYLLSIIIEQTVQRYILELNPFYTMKVPSKLGTGSGLILKLKEVYKVR